MLLGAGAYVPPDAGDHRTTSLDMTNAEAASLLSRIRSSAAIVEFRLRLARVLGLLPALLPAAALFAASAIALNKIVAVPATLLVLKVVLGFLAGSGLLLVLGSFLLPLAPNAGAAALDLRNKTGGRLISAIEFARIPEKDRTDLMELAIEDACAFVAEKPKSALRTAEAAPLFASLVIPPWLIAPLWLFSGGMLFVALWLFIPVVPPPEPPPPMVAVTNAVEMTEDDLDAFRDVAKELDARAKTPEMKVAVEKFNRLIEDLAEKRLDQVEALRQMQALENELLANAELDKTKLSEELGQTAKELEKSELAKDVAEALKKNDLQAAEKKMKELAEKVRKSPNKKQDKAALEKLREAMKKASERRKELEKTLEERREELQEQLLKKKKQVEEAKTPEEKEEEEKLLKKKERELERLTREQERQAAVNRSLSKLDRELAQAAQDLLREMGLTQEDLEKAAQDLERAAEDLERMQQEGMTDEQKEELKKKLEELRELMKNQEKGGQGAKDRLKKFLKQSRGGKPGEGEDGPQGNQPGKGKKGKGQQGDGEGEGEDGEGQGKGGKKPGGDGEGEGEGEGQGIGLGKGKGQGLEIPMPGQGDGPGGDKPGEGGGKGGKEWGKGAGGDVAGQETNPGFDTLDVEQQGLETNQGPTKSKTIQQAAERGFKGSDYEQVFKQYKTHAEDSIRKEQIPDGYRFYVQRYFQLIRPRD